MNRIEFIKSCGMTCLGGTAMLAMLESCSPVYYAVSTLEGKKITVSKSEFIQIKKDQRIERKFVLVQHESIKFPICLYRFSDTRSHCTPHGMHTPGCELHAHDTGLTCPCHGSEFNDHGLVTNPPAEDPLWRFMVTTDETNIYIALS